MTSRAGEVVRGVAAVVGVAAAVLGLPALIVALGSNPLAVLDLDWPTPAGVWEWLVATDYGLFKLSALIFVLLQVIFWLGWVWFTALIGHEFVTQIRARRGRSWPVAPAAIRRGIVAGLVAAILLLAAPGTPGVVDPPAVVDTSQLARPSSPPDLLADLSPASSVAAPPDRADQTAPGAAAEPAAQLPSYTVHVGDTLWGLAERYLGDGLRWRQIHHLNRATITDPDRLAPGLVLRMPAGAVLPPPPTDPGPGAHHVTVQPGDTLTAIAAAELGDPSAAGRLWEINQGRTQPDGRAMTHPDRLLPGWRLWIPAAAGQPGQPPHQLPGPAPGASQTPGPSPGPTQQGQNGHTAPPPSSTPAPPSPPTPGSSPTQPTLSPPTGVDLPAGTWVGAALVTAVAAAVVMLRRRRRHRNRPTPSLDPVPESPPLPPTARALWAAAHPTPGDSGETPEPNGDTPQAPNRSPAARPLWAPPDLTDQQNAPDTAGADHSPDTDLVSGLPGRGWPPPPPLVTGRTDAGERSAGLSGCAGLGLDGEGAAAAARAVMTELLGQDSLHPPVVHLTAEAAHRLFPDHRALLVGTAGVLVCHDSSEQAARALERELLRRLRLLDDHHPNPPAPAAAAGERFEQLRVGDPGQPLPTILLLTTTPHPGDAPALTGLLGLGQRVGIVAVVLGDWPRCITVDAEHRVTATAGEAVGHMLGAEIAALPQVEAAELLGVTLAARGGPDVLDTPQASPPARADVPAANLPRPDQPPSPAAPAQPAVYIRVFGVPRIEANGRQVRTGLERRARQVLLYLATHDDPVLADTLDEAIFADAADPRALRHTIISRIRGKLTTAADATTGIISLVEDHYRLNPQVVDTDVWRMHRLISAARAASSDQQRREQLAGLPELVAGEPLSGCGYDWAEPVAERLRQQAVNALLALAELTEQHTPATALAALAAAIRLNPYGEPLYYKAIAIQVANGDPHAAHQLYTQLERHLVEIDTEPEYSIDQLIPRTAPNSRSISTKESAPTTPPAAPSQASPARHRPSQR